MPMMVGNASKGLKMLKDVFKKGKDGVIKSKKTGELRFKPGYGEVAGKAGAQKLGGIGNAILRNPKTTLAVGAAALGGAYLYSQSGSSGANATGQQTYGYY
ncbi:hypothetical protein [Vampirovibrio chlorellavorus]|uniref:hypothetical protein n=1 Tax=Vampirovibrio chlorellavorus TaxID=758823 RepID=UPI0026EDEBC6|nr:hypothetical protein [Vampirovibrio chlorellavorus]